MISKAISSRIFVLLFPVAILLFDIVLFYFVQLGQSFQSFSAPLHFLGGVAMALWFFHFWESNPRLYSFKRKLWLNVVLVLGFVALVGVLWEFFEFFLDVFWPWLTPEGSAQLGLADTMADLFWDLTGGLVIAGLYFKSSLYKVLAESK